MGEIAGQGWAAVKSYSMLSEPAYLAVAEEAERRGLPLVRHILEGVTLGAALTAGHVSMEHVGRLAQAGSTEEAAMVARVRAALGAQDPPTALIAEMAGFNRIVLETWDAALCEAVIAGVAEAGLHVVPTLVWRTSAWASGPRPTRRGCGPYRRPCARAGGSPTSGSTP